MPRGKRNRIYNHIIDIAYELGITIHTNYEKIEQEMQNISDNFMQYQIKNVIKKEDIEPLYPSKTFTFQNFCRIFNLEPTLIQRYYKRPYEYQVELQFLYAVLNAIPNIPLIIPDYKAIYQKIKKNYGSLLEFEKHYYHRGYHRQYFYRLLSGSINLEHHQNYHRYLELMKILDIPVRFIYDNHMTPEKKKFLEYIQKQNQKNKQEALQIKQKFKNPNEHTTTKPQP
jgi:hypothetical protein